MRKHLIIFIVFAATYTTNGQEADLYKSETIPFSLLQNANAVVRMEEQDIRIRSHKKMNIRTKRIVTVLNEKGNTLVRAGSGYNKHHNIKKIQAVIYDKNGREIKKFKQKDFVDHSAVDGGTLYADSRVMYMAYTPISYPYTVEFILEEETPNTAFIPSWKPIGSYLMSVQNSRYTLTDEAGLNLRYQKNNFEGYAILESETQTQLSYTLTDTPGLRYEAFSPGFQYLVPEAIVAVEKFHLYGQDGRAEDWEGLGQFRIEALLEGRDKVSEATRQKVQDLINGEENPLEKARLVYEFVQKNTRYISVQIGIGGLQPISALEVDKHKYGDCKGLTNYTQSLLSIAGVDSYYTVVEAGKMRVDFEDDFASMAQGNHIILAIPHEDDLVWIDCTSSRHPFGFLGDFTDDRKAFMVKPGGSQIVKTPAYLNANNAQLTTAQIQLSSDTSLKADVTLSSTGIQYDNRFYLEWQTEEAVRDAYKKRWGYISRLQPESYTFDNDKRAVRFTEQIQVSAPGYAEENSGKLIFVPNAFQRQTFVPERYRSRKFPVSIPRGFYDEDHYTITLPEGFEIEALPENVRIENEFGHYELRITAQAGEIDYQRTFSLQDGTYPAASYSTYRDFIKTVTRHDAAIVVLKPIN